MSKEVDAAVELLKGALMREGQKYQTIEYFMGCTPLQIYKLKNYYRTNSGREPEDII